jgi:hypothetical protein
MKFLGQLLLLGEDGPLDEGMSQVHALHIFEYLADSGPLDQDLLDGLFVASEVFDGPSSMETVEVPGNSES